MNPKHRDRVAFVRIVSGKFERDMNVLNARAGERMRLGNSQRLFARERETVDDAYAGDVVGLVGNYDLLIGDTLASRARRDVSTKSRVSRRNVSPISTTRAPRNTNASATASNNCSRKAWPASSNCSTPDPTSVPLLGAVGPLQFEVLQYRLEGEYAAETRIEQANWNIARWLKPKEGDPLAPEARPSLSLGTALARDSNGWLVALLPSEWALKTFADKNEDWIISDQPFPPPVAQGK